MSIDKYFSKKYDIDNYNCAHFVAEVWKEETGNDIRENLAGYLEPSGARRVSMSQRRAFKRLERPCSPCVVLFQSHRIAPHVGIYLRGRVLHISSKQGVRFDELSAASIGYKKVGYFVC